MSSEKILVIGSNSFSGSHFVADVLKSRLNPATSTLDPIIIRALVEQICERYGVSFSNVEEETGERLGKDQSYLFNYSPKRETYSGKTRSGLKTGLLNSPIVM